MEYLIEVTSAGTTEANHGFFLATIEDASEIDKISVTIKLNHPNWVYRDDHWIPAGTTKIKLKIWGGIKSSAHIVCNTKDGSQIPSVVYYMVNYGPKQLYRLAKLLIDDHKYLNPGMLQ